MYKDHELNDAPLYNTGMVVWLKIPVIFREFDECDGWMDGPADGWTYGLMYTLIDRRSEEKFCQLFLKQQQQQQKQKQDVRWKFDIHLKTLFTSMKL